MMTVRQIERLWDAKHLRQLVGELLRGRPEASERAEAELTRVAPAAAMGLVRLEELTQASVPLHERLLQIVLRSQEADGGWGDAMATAVCLRALLCGCGDGLAIERGLEYLAELQRPDGLWPMVPLRRMPGDAYVTAFVLIQLGAEPRFRHSVRLTDAAQWLDQNGREMDADARRLWTHARFRCRVPSAIRGPVVAWS
jgi:hypothetical protein